MKALLVAASAVILVGCDGSTYPEPDQCMRVQLFQQCMGALPAGPQSTHYNDWNEVVHECGQQAYYQSLRSPDNIAKECRYRK
jgi:hypothetical protein